MEARFNYAQTAPGGYKAMLGLEQYLRECGLEESLLHLIKLRASRINGCAYCLDMHWKDLRAIPLFPYDSGGGLATDNTSLPSVFRVSRSSWACAA